MPHKSCIVPHREARGWHSWASSVCSRPSAGAMDDPAEDPDLEPVDGEILNIELLDGVDQDDNLEGEDEDDTEEVFETPRKRPSILLSLTGCSRVALSPFSDLEVPQTRLDPPTPSSPLSRSPSQFLRYPPKSYFTIFLVLPPDVSPTLADCQELARHPFSKTRMTREEIKMIRSVQKDPSLRLIWWPFLEP